MSKDLTNQQQIILLKIFSSELEKFTKNDYLKKETLIRDVLKNSFSKKRKIHL